MAFGSFFTRALDIITPWMRGGEVQRRNERKKREDEERQAQRNAYNGQPAPSQGNFNQTGQNAPNQEQQLKPQQPVNIFEGLNKDLVFNKPQTAVPVVNTQNNQPVQPPKPGDIVKPKQNLLDKMRDQFDANTPADQYRRQEENKKTAVKKPINYRNPVVDFAKRNLAPTGLFNVGKEIVQGGARSAIELPQTIEQSYRASKEGTRLRREGYVGPDIDEKARAAAPSKTWQPSGWQKRLFGDSKVQSLRDSSEELSTFIEQKTGKKPSPTALVSAMVLSYAIPGGVLGRKAETGLRVGERSFDDVARVLKDEAISDEAIARSAEKAIEATKPRPIPVKKNIPVNEVVGDNLDIPVQVTTPPKPKGPIIREMPGDAPALATNEDIAKYAGQIRQGEAEAINKVSVPNQRSIESFEGVTPRAPEKPFVLNEDRVVIGQDKVVDDYAGFLQDVGEKNGTQLVPDGEGGFTRTTNNVRFGDTGGKRMTKAMWRDEAERQLREGTAEPSLQKAYNESADPEIQALLERGERPDVPAGNPIAVKTVNGINVIDNTDVPTNLPETSGQVRVTTATAPSNVKSELVAAQPPALPPIPKVGSTTPDGKVVTKRMVQSARNQRKNAKAMAKAQDEAAVALERINAANNPNNALDSRQPGLILSDEIKKGRKGPYQVAKQADQTNELGTKSIGQVIEESDANVRANGAMTDRDVANVKAALDGGTVRPGTPEYKKLSDLYWKEAGTKSGQRLALRNQVSRRTASGKELYNRAVSKLYALADDPTKITEQHIADIERTADNFTLVRDNAKKAADDFNANPSKENYKRFMDTDKAAAKAEKDMAMAQYKAAKGALKGNTNTKLMREIEDQAENADLYTMDFVDSALLSSTGTFVRNFVNASLGSAEEGIFGGLGARIGRAVKGTPIGGGVGRGSISGFGRGASNIVDASKTRFKNAGLNPIEHMKNWSTTGNQLGDSMIEGSIGRSVRNHYEQMLKKLGYSGDELRMRADVMARQDPENLARDVYAPQARLAAGLGSGIAKRSSWEKSVQRGIADKVAEVMGKEYSSGGEAFAKGVTRVVLGYPSAVGRSLAAGAQRVVPFANIDTVKALTANNPTARAAAIKESIKKSGSAATVMTVFGAMGANGNITGAYPKDPNERAKWEREQIKENSIKIGDAWYDIPSYMGSFGLPVLLSASIGRNGGINKESLADMKGIVGALSPTDGIDKINDMLDGRLDFGKYTQGVVSSAARMATPYGSLLNQISKVFDPTQNDTSGDSWVEGTLNKIMDGVPFLDQRLPDKTDKEGNVLYNPSVVETMVGAAGAVQKGGEERSAQINQETNSVLEQIDKYGLLNDKNLDGVLKESGLEAFNKAKSGKQLDESEIKALKEGLVKGVSSEGTDTAYLEKGQYDTNLAVLKMKRDLMNSDPTVKPSSLKDIDVAIKRGEVYRDNKIPYDLIKGYKDTSLTEWRNMGNPKHDDYDPEQYETLWKIDELMTKAKVSDNYKGKMDKPKYSAKKPGKGRGGRGGRGSGGSGGAARNIDTSFGRLKTPSYAPRAQQYASISAQSGTIPYIARKRPNIVHKITSSG